MNNQLTQEIPLLLSSHDFAAVQLGIKTEHRLPDLQLDLITGVGIPIQSPTLSPDSKWIFACIKGIDADLLSPYGCPQRGPVRYLARQSGQRWDSRFPLKGISVHPERLGDISPEGAIAEGIELDPDVVDGSPYEKYKWVYAQVWRDYLNGGYGLTPVQSYVSLWQSIHGEDAWDPRQWVWVVRFEKEV